MRTGHSLFRNLSIFIILCLAASPILTAEGAVPARVDAEAKAQISARLTQADEPVEGLDGILEQIESQEYDVTWVEHTYLPELPAAYQAPNRASGFRTYFTDKGAVIIPRLLQDGEPPPWRWDVSLVGWGWGAPGQPAGAQSPMVSPDSSEPLAVTQNRIEMRRGAINEWYLNDENGLQQGFDILAADGGASSLQIELAVDTTLLGEWAALDNGVTFRSPDGMAGVQYGLPTAEDATGATLPATLKWSGDSLLIQIDTSEAIFPLQVKTHIVEISTAPIWELVGLTFSLYEGLQVATAGDVNGDEYSDIIIGAPYYDDGTKPNQGAVWIYAGGKNMSSLSQIFYRLGGQEEAWFGYSVSTAGDVNGDGYADVIVGAPMWDGEDDQTNEGAVWIFHGGSTGIDTTPDRYIQGGQANANFGKSVSFAGDVNRDNYSDVIVGAPAYNTTLYGQGKVFVYHGSASGIGTSANWVAVATEPDDSKLGWSVATAGDVNGDRYADIIVGAPGYEYYEEDQGAVFVWYGSASGVNEDIDGTIGNADWTFVEDTPPSQNGYVVSTAGDVNGDGYSDVFIGTPYGYWDANGEGSAFLFLGSSTGLLEEMDNYDYGREADNHFAWSVACAGDVNGDGYADVIAGEPDVDVTYTDEGRAYVWYGHASGISGNADWYTLGGYANARYGASVATAGDLNGDGYSEVIVAAPAKAGTLGVVRLYAGGPEATQENSAWHKASNLDGTPQFGYSVSTAGDVNGDGYSDVIVGAPYYDDGQTDEGGVFIYKGTETGLQPSGYYWKKTADLAGARFGWSAAGAGDVDGDGYDDVIVGAPYWEQGTGGADEGGAWVYRGSAAGMVSAPYWGKESDQAGALFGFSVAGAGDTNGDGFAEVIIGAPMMENSADHTDEGLMFVYRGSASGISTTPYFSKDADKPGTHYGYSVASAGDTNRDGYADIIVGAPDYTSTYAAEGGAWVYLGQADRMISAPDWYDTGGQANAHFGFSVAGAGDVNGDGYSDVIAGAPDYDDGQAGEGGVWAYHGSSAGLSDTAAWHREAGQEDAFYGFSVSTAGDVNGDGYADVVVGARGMTDSVTDEGTARVFLGSLSGLGNAVWFGAGGETNSYYGFSVATAGDVNGDGYDEIIVGAPRYGTSTETPPADQGRVLVYYGGGGAGESLLPRQQNADDSPIAHLGRTLHPQFFALKLLGKSPFWSGSMGITTEVKLLSQVLNGLDAAYIDFTQTSFGSEKFVWYFERQPGAVYHWRARLRFNPASQPYLPATHWISMPYHGANEADLRMAYLYSYLPLIMK